jgi:hypothetical protein
VTEAAFYCVADSSYFLGAVGMLNSLRVLGHREPVFILDCGLTDAQRELLSPHAELVPGSVDVPPCLLKTVAPLRHPAEVMVLIDADIVATRSFAELIERASGGRVLAIKDGEDRYFTEWGDLLGTAVPQRQPYVSSSLVILGGGPGHEVVRLMDELGTQIDVRGSPFATRVPDRAVFRGDYAAAASSHPFFYPEQDLLNAILAAKLDPRQVEVLDRRLEADPPFAGVRVLDEMTLRCAHRDGTEPYALHHFAVKPWLEPARHGAYSRLLRRLLTGTDVPMRVSEEELPLRLRSGARAWLDRKRVDLGETIHWHIREPLAARVRSWTARD